MAKISTLILLISSLSKTEKRYFKLHSALQKGPKDYLELFNIIEKCKNDSMLRNSFLKLCPQASYATTMKHLYKVLTDCLLRLRMEQDKNSTLLTRLLKANILFEKSLYEEGFKQLQKIQANAQEHEQYIIQLWASRLELYYLANLNFHAITEFELIQKQMKIQEVLRYASINLQHNSLYELLHHRFIHKGNIRTADHKRELNDLIVSEINLVSSAVNETFETQKIHLLFQSQYFITINDYKSALKTFYELNDLLEKHQYLWIDSLIDYISAIEGILQSLRAMHQYKEMNYFLSKLQKLEKKSVFLQVLIEKVCYIYSIAGLLDQGEFKKAVRLKAEFQHSLFKKISVLDLDKQAEVYLYTSLIYFSDNNMTQSHYYLSKVLLDGSRYYNLPIYQTFRLIHLLVHYELGNTDFILHEIRSVKRKLNNMRSKTYKLEKIVFRFIQISIISISTKDRLTLWLNFKQLFDKISSDKYEIQILKIFDFASWIESKITRTNFAELLKNKSNTSV